ncbi:calcium/proton exchanger [Alteribacter lacisalsi]|uniref:Ca(2+)/H(+) antiporter n=1 Tax=Alteribacter lacisalsi TaxID=2045244 RepID=A0A2W0HES9_9BACI|nr:calcium/proton exchanger [Alteribacter lacisalsi]PYZ95815.1 calcium/proton exchanger [Alteribacter lacisalsi]
MLFTWIPRILVFGGIPLVALTDLLGLNVNLKFALCAITIVGLAVYMGRATDSVSIHTGPRIGGILNATFGNAVELIISIFSLKAGFITIVLASMAGAIIGNLLLVAGLSFLIGGILHKRQQFNIFDARFHVGMLMFGIIVAFVIPRVFNLDGVGQDGFILSVAISIILIILYILGIYFRLFAQRGAYPVDEESENKEDAEWSKKKSIGVLIAATVGVGYISENLVGTFEEVVASFGFSEVFIGIILIAIIGNAAENASAVYMAYLNKIEVSIEIAIGSCIQIAMFVLPVLVLLSFALGTPMPLVFSFQELIAMVLAAFLTIVIINDGDTNWFEGATLLAAYLIMGIGFFLL